MDSSLSVAVDSLSAASDLLLLREESEWPVPERDLEGEPLAVRERLDLNAASAPELSARLGLSGPELERLLAARDSLGGFRTLRDLRHLGAELQQKLTELRSRFRLSRQPPAAAIRLRASLSQNEPDEQRWVSPWKTYLRASLGLSGSLRVGFLGEKDAGEPYRFAFASAYLLLERLGPLEQVILGDYTLHAGQGLVLGRAGGFHRDLPVRENVLPSPHTYADETGYFRGLAITSHMAGVHMSVFYSVARRAASGTEEGMPRDLVDGGLFRTPGEQASYDGLRERTLGAQLRAFPTGDIEIGLAAFHTEFSPGLVGEGRSPLERARGVGLTCRVHLKGSILEGELGLLEPGGPVVAACWWIPIDKGGSFLLGMRHYAPSSPGFFSSAPGRGGVSANEQGASMSLRFSPLRSWNVAVGLDLCRELFPTKRTPLARRFADGSVTVRMPVSSRTDCSLRWRSVGASQRSPVEDCRGRSSWELIWTERHSLTLALRHRVGNLLAGTSRIEMVEMRWQGRGAADRGWLLSQAITVTPVRGVSLVGSIAIARTSSYPSRIYLVEHDHSGVGGFQALYGGAVRHYLLLRLALPWGLRLSVKWASSELDPPPASDYRAGERLRRSLVSVQMEGSW